MDAFVVTYADRRSLIAVCAVALALRLIPLAAAWPDPSRLLSPPDSTEYVTIARNVIAGHGFSMDTAPPYRPDVRRTPIYPSLIAGVFLVPGADERGAGLLGVMASAATVAMTWVAGWALFGRGAAGAAGLLLAVDITSIAYGGLILTEAIFTFLLVAAIAAMLSRPMRSSVAVRGGLLLGGAALCRPAGIFLAPASLAVCAWRQPGRRDVVRRYAALNAVFAVVALVWIGRNAIVAGTPTISSIGSINLYFHRAAAIEARLEGRNIDDVRAAWERRFESMSNEWTESAKLEWMTAHAQRVIADHPGLYLLMTVEGLVGMMQSDEVELFRVLGVREGSAAFRAIGIAGSLQLWILYPAALVGLIAAGSDPARRTAALIPLTFIAYFILIVAGPEAYARFRVPIMPFVAMLGGLGIHESIGWMRSPGGVR